MPWGVAAAAVAAGGSIYSSSQAGKAQQNATNSAIGEQQREYDQTRSDNQTALDARNNGLAQMQNLAGQFGTGMPTSDQVMATPGYQFGLSQGTQSLNNNAAMGGGLYSGAQLKAASQFGNDYATTKYDDSLNNLRNSQADQFNRYASISGMGQLGTNAINSAGQNSANNISSLTSSLGNALGAHDIANGNTYGGLASQIGSAGKSWWGSRSGLTVSGGGYTAPSYYNPNVGGNGAGGSPDGYYADGGPVRVEPVIGSRSPVRTGGGGGLSPAAVRAAMDQAPPAPPKPVLPANPLMQPGVILDGQMKQAGAYADGGEVSGPGGPKDDRIHAMLSNGEHVLTADSVNKLGGGDNDAGQKKLNKLQAMLRGC